MENLESHRIPHLPNSIYYLPSFLSPHEESLLLSRIPPNRWIHLSNRRLQAHPTQLTPNNTLLSSTPLPTWLASPYVERIQALGVFDWGGKAGINHCLVNEYLPGQGIMGHEDGPAYYPIVATISLGGSTVLNITAKPNADAPNEEQKTYRIFQEPRSLLITTGDAYTSTLHAIAEVEVDEDLNAETVANWSLLGEQPVDGRRERTTRVSLTFREVRKVAKVGGKLFGKTRS